MVELSDITLIEADGEYHKVCKLMQASGTWMLTSNVFVSTPIISSTFIVHFWNDGKVVIHDLSRVVRMDLPDDDIRVLARWCKIHGWGNLEVHDRLIVDKAGFDYWQRSYRAGVVENNQFIDHEKAEITRLAKAYEKERE